MIQDEQSDVTFSFVCPVFNEQEGLERFYKRLTAVAARLGEPYEIVFINDGSTDDTAGVVRHLMGTDRRIRYVEFSRNFGHQVAVTAGYDYACGKAVISLDSDCQHPPEVIPELVARWREGFEVVYTTRRDTEGISPLRRGIGRLTYRVISLMSGADLTDQADFRLLDRKVVLALQTTREHARFVRGLVHWLGFKQIGVPYTAERRVAGRSNYTLKQLVHMSTAGMYNFSVKPLRAASVVGALLLTAAVLYTFVSLILWPLDEAPGAIANLAMAMVALFGLQFLAIGVLGEYIGRIFEEAKGRPIYVVRETAGFEIAKPLEPIPARPMAADRTSSKKFLLYT